MATYAAWYDASGSEGNQDPEDPIVVAGLVSTAARWKRFEKEWASLLAANGVPNFRRSDFLERKTPFAAWGEARSEQFLDGLVRTIKRNISKAFVVKLTPANFRETDQSFQLHEQWQSPYPLAMTTCLGRVQKWLNGPEHRDRVLLPLEHNVERGDNGERRFVELSRFLGFEPVMRSKRNLQTGRWWHQLQACDLVAGEYANVYRDHPNYVPRAAMEALVKHVPTEPYEHNASTLRAMCEAYPEIFPPRRGGGKELGRPGHENP